MGFALISPWAMQECRPCRALSVSDTKPQSISMHQHIRANECPTTAIQSDNNPSHHRPSANPFGFIHYMEMGEPFRAILLQSPGWRECQRYEQNPGYTWTKNKSSAGAALSARAFGLYCCGSWLCIRWESAAPVGGSIKCMSMPNPGLAPWAMQECRPCRAYITFRFVCPQGFILGFALISPWAMQEYRPYRASLRLPIYFIILMRLPYDVLTSAVTHKQLSLPL